MNAFSAILLLCLPILLSGLLTLKIGIQQTYLRLLLAFSAAYLFSIAIIHLLPEAFEGLEESAGNFKITGLFIVLGFSIQLIIDTFSTGIEHGHVHLHSNECHNHLPYGIITGLMLHSFLEGLPTYNVNAGQDLAVNHQLIYGLMMHNIPISIAFVILLKEHRTSTFKIILLLFTLSMMAPLGFLTGMSLHHFGMTEYQAFLRAAFALVIGIFLHISTAILFETSEHHKYNLAKVVMMISGIVLAYLIS